MGDVVTRVDGKERVGAEGMCVSGWIGQQEICLCQLIRIKAGNLVENVRNRCDATVKGL